MSSSSTSSSVALDPWSRICACNSSRPVQSIFFALSYWDQVVHYLHHPAQLSAQPIAQRPEPHCCARLCLLPVDTECATPIVQ
jgi:hypothetical protein